MINDPLDYLINIVGADVAVLATDKLTDNLKVYEYLENLAIGSLQHGDLYSAFGLTQLAANQAWMRSSGFFSALKLEECISEIARRVQLPAVQDVKLSKNSVCHILTRAKVVGGHTKLVCRWVFEQRDKCHNLILTRQMGARVPSSLIEAIKQSGGVIIDLQEKQHQWEKRLSLLVYMIESSSAVVMHTHPYDALAIIAIRKSTSRPPVAYMNHADHVFWLGANVADLYIHIRESAIDLSVSRRGISRANCSVLPIPIDQRPRSFKDRLSSRKELGICESTIVALTIASGYKMMKLGLVDFARHHAELASRHENFIHIIIGNESDARWDEASRISNGRLRVLPPTPKVKRYLLAADFYVDSYPLGSITSYLEAAAAGLPIIGFDPWMGLGRVICSPEAMVNDSASKFKFIDKDEYNSSFDLLIASQELRTETGLDLTEKIESHYASDAWRQTLNNLWQRFESTDIAIENRLSLDEQNCNIELIDYILVLLGQRSGDNTNDVDILMAGLPLKVKMDLLGNIKFGLPGLLPERLLRKINALK